MAVSFVQATGAGTSTAILLPSSRVAGDLLILSMATENTQPSSAPSGWFLIGSQGRGTAGDNTVACRIVLYGRISDASDSSFDTINTAGMVAGPYVHATTAWRGVSPIDPVADTIGFGSGASAGSHATNRTAEIAYDGSMLVLASALAEPAAQSFSSSTGLSLSERVDVLSNQGLGVVSAPIDAQASVTETITSTHAPTPFVSVFICLNPDVPLTVDVTVDGSMGALTAEAEVSFQNAAVDGSMGALTAEAEVSLFNQLSVDGSMGALTAEGLVTNGIHQITVEATLGSFTASAEVLPGQLIEAAGSMGAFTLTSFVAMPISIFGNLGAITGEVEIEQTNLVTVDGSLGAFMAEASVIVNVSRDITVDGSLGAFTSEGLVDSGISVCYEQDRDRRELILDRLDVILSTVPGVVRAKRNDPSVPEGLRPASLLLDSDEDMDPRGAGRNRPSFAPFIVNMRPEIYLLLEGEPEEAGRDLNALHDEVLSLVLRDGPLLALTLDGKGVKYEGARAGFGLGRQMEAEMAMDFTITFYENPEPLCEPLAAPDEPFLPDEPIRERVLAAFARALEATEGVVTFKRNEVVTADGFVPAVMMLDGDEFAHERDSGNGRPAHGPVRVRVEPEVYVVVDTPPIDVGPALNRLRLMLIRAVLNDALLTSLCHTGLSLGRSMAGEMGLKFTATYVLNP
jgi:hypothetical protein